jgi:hypothetical protein
VSAEVSGRMMNSSAGHWDDVAGMFSMLSRGQCNGPKKSRGKGRETVGYKIRRLMRCSRPSGERRLTRRGAIICHLAEGRIYV